MFLTATGAVAICILFLAYISKFVIGCWCLFCIGMYGVNFILTLLGTRWTAVQARSLRQKEMTTNLVLMSMPSLEEKILQVELSCLPLWSSLSVDFLSNTDAPSKKTASETVADLDTWYLLQPNAPVSLDGTEPIYGNPDAKYTVVEFADFECPYCGMVAPELKNL